MTWFLTTLNAGQISSSTARRQTATWNLSSSGAALGIQLENNFNMLRSLSSSGAPHQSLLDVAHIALLSRGLHVARVLG
jgi:hypothetical protein